MEMQVLVAELLSTFEFSPSEEGLELQHMLRVADYHTRRQRKGSRRRAGSIARRSCQRVRCGTAAKGRKEGYFGL